MRNSPLDVGDVFVIRLLLPVPCWAPSNTALQAILWVRKQYPEKTWSIAPHFHPRTREMPSDECLWVGVLLQLTNT